MSNNAEFMEALAAEIGENVYIDIAKWHLYLSYAKLHTVVAEKAYPLISSNKTVNLEDVNQLLQSISIKIGGGKRELPLVEFVPSQCQSNLVDILEKYQQEY